MRFENPLIQGTLIKRYKRFLADIRLGDGTEITASVPNTGSMMGLSALGSLVWLSVHDGEKRKFAHVLQLVEADGAIVGINTGMPNKLAEEAIGLGMISNLANFHTLTREQKYGKNSRVDILLDDPKLGQAYVEVKNVHFIRTKGLAEFPDSVTARGAKHLEELCTMVAAGHRAIMLYVVQRADCTQFQLCREMDRIYCDAFDRAVKAGVEAYAIRCKITKEAITPDVTIPIKDTVLMELYN